MRNLLYACELYPCTVVYDRYGGCYSGGQYTAWHCDPWDVPEEIECDDVTCGWFWMRKEEIEIPYGVGNTPDEAALNLAKKMNIKELV